jgi:hypothetical protein
MTIATRASPAPSTASFPTAAIGRMAVESLPCCRKRAPYFGEITEVGLPSTEFRETLLLP